MFLNRLEPLQNIYDVVSRPDKENVYDHTPFLLVRNKNNSALLNNK